MVALHIPKTRWRGVGGWEGEAVLQDEAFVLRGGMLLDVHEFCDVETHFNLKRISAEDLHRGN
jgi:hypothetical protein